MKNLNSILFGVALAGTFSVVSNASAQFKVIEDDGLAASPRVRQMLNERRAASTTAVAPTSVTVASVPSGAASHDIIAASPRARQMLGERKLAPSPTTTAIASASAGYKPTGEDGITASPKLRQQLNERGTSFMIAPVK